MILYDIRGFINYKVTDTGKVYSVVNGRLDKVFPTESGGYVLYNTEGRQYLFTHKIMHLADLPYEQYMYVPPKYKKHTEEQTKRRRDLEDYLWEKQNEF
jgi:hypothetical protein